jgi:hypothetical protein
MNAYLAANPDVAVAVQRGDLESRRTHFEAFRGKEARLLRLSSMDAFEVAKKEEARARSALAASRYTLRSGTGCLGLSDAGIARAVRDCRLFPHAVGHIFKLPRDHNRPCFPQVGAFLR